MSRVPLSLSPDDSTLTASLPAPASQAITTFLDDGHELGCSQSYAKNMGLYGQRTGCFSLVVSDKSHVRRPPAPRGLVVVRQTEERARAREREWSCS